MGALTLTLFGGIYHPNDGSPHSNNHKHPDYVGKPLVNPCHPEWQTDTQT